MIRVAICNPWRKEEREYDLDVALAPPLDHDGGIAERALENSNDLASAIGKLLAALVARGVLTLDEAKDAAGVHDDMRIVR